MTNDASRRGKRAIAIRRGGGEVCSEYDEVIRLLKEIRAEVRAHEEESRKNTEALEMLQAMAEAI